MKKKILATSTGIVGAIIASIIFVEGGYTDDSFDPGGKTKFGITEKVAREYGYTGSMEDLTKDTATDIYSTLYVYQPNFDKFIEINPAIAHKLINSGVNVGTVRVTYWLQSSLNLYSRAGRDYKKITEDGVLGDDTIRAYKDLERIRGKETACSLVLKALDANQLAHYASLTSLSRYIVGWVDKRIGNIPLSQCSSYTLTLPTLESK